MPQLTGIIRDQSGAFEIKWYEKPAELTGEALRLQQQLAYTHARNKNNKKKNDLDQDLDQESLDQDHKQDQENKIKTDQEKQEQDQEQQDDLDFLGQPDLEVVAEPVDDIFVADDDALRAEAEYYSQIEDVDIDDEPAILTKNTSQAPVPVTKSVESTQFFQKTTLNSRSERVCSRCQAVGLTPEEQIAFYHQLPQRERTLIDGMLKRIRSLDDVDFWIRRWSVRYPGIDIVLCMSEFAVYCQKMDKTSASFAVSRINLENLFSSRQRIAEQQEEERQRDQERYKSRSLSTRPTSGLSRAALLEKRREYAYQRILQERGQELADKFFIGRHNQVIPYWEAANDAELLAKLAPYRIDTQDKHSDFLVPLSGEENTYFTEINLRAVCEIN